MSGLDTLQLAEGSLQTAELVGLRKVLDSKEAELEQLHNEMALRPSEEPFQIRQPEPSDEVAELRGKVSSLQEELRGHNFSTPFANESPQKRHKRLQMQRLQEDVRSLEAELKTAHERNEQTQAEFEKLASLRCSLESQVVRLEEVLQRERREEKQRRELVDVKDRQRNLEVEKTAVEGEIAVVRKELEESEASRAELDELLRATKAELTKLEGTRTQFSLKSEVESLKDQLEVGSEESAEELEDAEIEQLQQAVESVPSGEAPAGDEKALKAKLAKYAEGLQKLKGVCTSLKEKCQDLSAEKEELQQQVASLPQATGEASSEEEAKLKEQIRSMAEEMSSWKARSFRWRTRWRISRSSWRRAASSRPKSWRRFAMQWPPRTRSYRNRPATTSHWSLRSTA